MTSWSHLLALECRPLWEPPVTIGPQSPDLLLLGVKVGRQVFGASTQAASDHGQKSGSLRPALSPQVSLDLASRSRSGPAPLSYMLPPLGL
jgi:hypothetical protein